MHYTRIEIDSKKLINNIISVRNWLSKYDDKIKYCLPVKANAYGHGLVGIAKLTEPYVDYFGVACLDEGEKLRVNGIAKPIIVFGAFADEQVDGLIANNLEITISSLYKAKLVADFCYLHGKKAKVHIKVDTGMNRVGVRVESAPMLIKFIQDNKCFELIGIYSHLANSDVEDDPYTLEQVEQFSIIARQVKQEMPDIICHLANSGGVVNYRNSLFDMVRPGIISYGYSPNNADSSGILSHIQPCLSLKSQVTFFKVVKTGQGISYNHKYITDAVTRVVTIPIGYGDGYRRALSNIGEVIINGNRYRISGTVCMDMLMVDIGITGTAYVGDEAIFIGKYGNQELLLQSLAEKCGTIVYEILCGFNERIPRIYI